MDRYEIFYRRLEQEGCYSAAAVIASSKEEGTAWGAYRNLSENTSFERFIPEFITLLVKPRAELIHDEVDRQRSAIAARRTGMHTRAAVL